MTEGTEVIRAHPEGEQPLVEVGCDPPVGVDTYAGRVHVDWQPDAPITPLGQLPFFIDFLKTAGLFDNWVAACPLHYTSPNAPSKRDVLGTVLLSVLSGHRHHYAHHRVASRCGQSAVAGNEQGARRTRSRRGFRRSS